MTSLLSRSAFLLAAVLALAWFAGPAEAAVVVTKHGEREGRVIVREFEQLVVTIVTENNRIFQFYAQDVQKVTSTAKILLAERAHLRSEPDEDADIVTELAMGTQVSPQGNANDNGWIHIKAWGNHEGWLPVSVLTDRVDFGEALRDDETYDFDTVEAIPDELEPADDDNGESNDAPHDEALDSDEPEDSSEEFNEEPESEDDD